MIDEAGKVGIGTTNPGGPLGRGFYRNPGGSRSAPTTMMELFGAAGTAELIVTSMHDDATEYAALTLRSADADHSWGHDNDLAGVIAFATNDSTGTSGENEWMDIATIKGRLAMDTENNGAAGDLEFWTSNNAMTTTQRMVILANGDVGIGTASPARPLHVYSNVNLSTVYLESGANVSTESGIQLENKSESFSGRLLQVLTYTDAGTGWNAIYCRADEDNGGAGQNPIWRVRGDGGTYADNAYSSGGADYAEYFESKNGNEIVVGTTVKLDGDKIVPCDSETSPIGVIRAKNGNSVVVGNAYNNRWCQMYKQDDYGAYEYDDDKHMVRNPDYIKPTEENPYIPREERDEWCLVGLLGQIPITKGQPVADSWIKMKDVSDTVEMWFVK